MWTKEKPLKALKFLKKVNNCQKKDGKKQKEEPNQAANTVAKPRQDSLANDNIEGSPALSSVFETEARAGNVRQSVGQSVRGRWSAVEALLQHFDQLVAHVGCLVVDGIAARKVQPDLGDEPVAPSE